MPVTPARAQHKTTMLALVLVAVFSGVALGQDRLASVNLEKLDLPTYSRLSDGAGDVQTTLAGLVLDGSDLPVALAVRLGESPEQAQVAVESLLRGLGLEPVLQEDGSWRVQTPLGRVLVPASLLSRHGEADYALLIDMARLLGIRLEYDDSAAAVIAGTNWPLAVRQSAPPPEDVVRPTADVSAPGSNLSYWRTEAYITHSDAGTTTLVASDVGGGLAGGFWRARYEDDLDESHRLRDYAWVRTDGSLRWLLGNQRVNSHPLLGSFDLTGAQAAWTNRPDLLYTGMIGYGELVSGRVVPASNLRGSGPPGGIADLLYDGIVVARIAIPLDGRYEFRDLTLPRGVATRVQVALYEPGALGAPLRIEDRSGQASDQLLTRGTVLHYAGFGQNGNPLDPDDVSEGSAAFYEGRFGLLPGMTVDIAGQQVDGVGSWLTGMVASLGRLGVASAHLAQRGEHQSWQVIGDGTRGAAFWRMQAREQDDGYAGVGLEGYSERYLETGWRGAKWTLGLVGRDIEGALVAEPVRYLKPTLDWYPLANLSFSARPDLDGDYQYTAQWSVTPKTRIGAYYTNDSDRLELDHRFNDRWRTTLGRVAFQGETRHSVMFTRNRRGASDYGLSLAVLESAGEFGYLASLDTELRPGLSLRVQAYEDPLAAAFGSSGGPVFQLSFVADFAVTPQGLAAGSYRRSLVEQGGVSGQLVLPLEGDFAGAGAAVWVDGQRRGKVDENGRFHVRDLSPGIHRVQVDEGALPIEMSLDKSERWVEVRAGVVTPVEFPLSLSLGFGGQLRDADNAPVASTELVVVDTAGEVTARTRTDAWGYYRIDGLKPGRYHLRSAGGADLHGQAIELSSGFKFGVDARQPAGPPER